MAQDCFVIFQRVFQQGKNNGLADAVATAAAQTAMQDCLQKQAARPSTVAQPISVVEGSPNDPGPVVAPKPQR